ncbi:MAG: hypothetical protein E7294_03250 [Lachnospiraceae bacterium]|jgi:flagellar protein FlgJ|nr:hypothetical protein [Lachnospiraceae bacterium]
MELDGITSAYINQINTVRKDEAAKQIEALTKKTDFSKATDDELMKACKQFESYLLEQVMKHMGKTTSLFGEENEGTNGQLVDFFMDSTMQKVADDISDKKGMGIARHLYEAMKREYHIPEGPEVLQTKE